jgi:cell division initiation protein
VPYPSKDSYKPTFEIKRRGYDRDAVDAHIDWLVATYDETRAEHDRMTAQVGELQRELDAYRGLEQRVGNALLLAEGAAADVRAKAEAEGGEIVERARRDAEDLLARTRDDHARLTAEVERLRSLRSELVSSYRAFLLSALEVVQDEPLGDGPHDEPAHYESAAEGAHQPEIVPGEPVTAG